VVNGRKTIALRNDLAEIRTLHAAVNEFGEKHGLSEEVVFDVRLALEEIVANVIRYGYDDEKEHRITVRLAVGEGELTAEERDDGIPFNPLDAPAPDTETPLDERAPGGLGIFLARKAMDDMQYRRERNMNILIMRKRL
jgi:anti-sigma regulatory factor (Ser/Thr protein kinase)